jgi:RimJ/RimL family protein N-acetyltransferase
MTTEKGPALRTERLLLRRWRDDDVAPFAAMNGDPVVMEHFVSTLSVDETAAFVERIESTFEQRGYGLWAVEVPRVAPFIGFVGLAYQDFEAPFTPAVEVGWRLAKEHWGHGYATEGGRAAVRFAFDDLELPDIVSMTAVGNVRSRHVMERLGMTRDPNDDFDHPAVPPGHVIRRHVLYRLRRTPA